MAIKFLNTVAVDTNVLYVDAINNRVGIGTNNPDARLSVSDDGQAVFEILPFTNDYGTTLRSYDTVDDDFNYLSYKASVHRFHIGDAEKMRINSSGNVGIGDTVPNVKLHVSTSSPTNNVAVSIGDGWVGNSSYHKEGGLLLISGTSQDVTQTGAGIAFQTRNTPNTNYWKSSMIMGRDGAIRFTLGGAGTVAGSEDFTILSNGNVGIGATSPSQKTVISGPSTNPLFNTTVPSAATLLLSNSDVAYGTYFGSLGTGVGLIQQRRQTSAVYYGLAINPYGGNVGIGTTSPDQKLHIKGGDIQTQDTTGLNGVLRIRATITGTPSTGGYPNVGAGDAVIEGGGTTQRQPGVITLMNGDSSISSGQDLGVIQFVGKDDSATGYCTSQIISTTSGTAGSGASGGGILRFLTSSGNTGSAVEERMRINNSGRVMIGTTTSTSNANLTVKESLAIQSGSSTVLSISTAYGSSFINTGTSGGTVNFGLPSSYTTNVYVQGTIEAVSSVQMGNNTAAASAANAGSTRYRVSGNNSYMDMSMRTGATTYAWVNIVQNNW
mgnify:CR=1 FL=1